MCLQRTGVRDDLFNAVSVTVVSSHLSMEKADLALGTVDFQVATMSGIKVDFEATLCGPSSDALYIIFGQPGSLPIWMQSSSVGARRSSGLRELGSMNPCGNSGSRRRLKSLS